MMIKRMAFSICILLQTLTLSAQNVGIGTSSPNSSAQLHIEASDRGILIPQVSLVEVSNGVTPVNIPATGLLVWNTNLSVINGAGVGFYYWTGIIWEKLASGGSSDGWLIDGNLGTINGTNFLGTIDNQALDIRTNNVIHTRITTKGQIETLNTGRSVFVGEGAGASDDLGDNRNVFVGYFSGNSTTSGTRNTALGYLSLENNTTGTQNVAIGTDALNANTTGNFNTAIGPSTLELNTEGQQNVAIGLSALQENIDGNFNIAIGSIALEKNQSGGNNLAIGFSSMNRNISGYNNIGLGNSTLYENTGGYENIGVGPSAMRDNTLGYSNTGIGSAALSDNISGHHNVALGHAAVTNNQTGDYNVGVGFRALYYNLGANGNTAVGREALFESISGEDNTAVGYHALRGNTTGNDNTAVGHNAGEDNATGSNNTFVGHNADANSANLTNVTAIGYNAKVNISNALILGGTGADAVNVGIGTETPSQTLEVCGNAKIVGQIEANSSNLTAGLTCSSDQRLKKNIATYDNALETIGLLKGKKYNWRSKEFTDRGFDERIKYGFIAQEIEKVLPNLVYEDKKGFKSVDYIQVIPILTNAIQEQQKELVQIKEQYKTLFAKLETITSENSTIKAQLSSMTTTQNDSEKLN
jgi:hypothetical protein